MRNINLVIKDLDINTEDFICDFIDRLGYSYFVQEVKAPKQKKEKTIDDIFDEIQRRYEASNYNLVNKYNGVNKTTILIYHSKKGYKIGQSKCNPIDKYQQLVGYYLALTRACGWEDLEQELLSKL